MRLMIASDIHGSAYYCKKMLGRYQEEGAERLLLLGDLLYHGPRNDLPREYAPKEVISMLNGAREELLCVRGNCDAEVDQMVLQFPILSEAGDVLLHGHTHVQAMEDRGDYVYLNPGSVSIPKNGNENSYMIYENGRFIIKNMEGSEIRNFVLA